MSASGGALKVVIWEEMEDDYEEGSAVQAVQTAEELQDAGPGVTKPQQVVPTFTTEGRHDPPMSFILGPAPTDF